MIKETDILLTTKDNPHNPFTEYDDWKYFDEKRKHYNTEAYVARDIGMVDPNLTNEELAHLRVESFKEIIRLNDEIGLDIYTMITRDGEKLDPTPSVYLEQDTPGEDEQETTPVEDVEEKKDM